MNKAAGAHCSGTKLKKLRKKYEVIELHFGLPVLRKNGGKGDILQSKPLYDVSYLGFSPSLVESLKKLHYGLAVQVSSYALTYL